jgi:hypothetical protein
VRRFNGIRESVMRISLLVTLAATFAGAADRPDLPAQLTHLESFGHSPREQHQPAPLYGDDRPGCHIEECALDGAVAELDRPGRVCDCAVRDQRLAVQEAVTELLFEG